MITNYHTHTQRCYHAKGKDEEFVIAAIERGLKVLGFADHGPWPYENYVSGMRMPLSEAEDYIRSINALKKKYADKIEIKLGFEYEYFPEYTDWLREFIRENGIDYIILGHHFVPREIGGAYAGRLMPVNVLYDYCDQVCEGIKTGLFAYVAHPDLYMREYPSFDEHARAVANKICDTAKECDIPLEYNILGLRKAENEGKEGYPYHSFWEIAAEKSNRVILGIDAHTPQEITDSKYINLAEKAVAELGLEVCRYI